MEIVIRKCKFCGKHKETRYVVDLNGYYCRECIRKIRSKDNPKTYEPVVTSGRRIICDHRGNILKIEDFVPDPDSVVADFQW